MFLIIGILHNAKYAFGHNPLSFSGQRKVRLGEVRKNANFVLTMPFVRYENAIYADNANCANQNANYDDNAICACFTMLVCLGCTFGIVYNAICISPTIVGALCTMPNMHLGINHYNFLVNRKLG